MAGTHALWTLTHVKEHTELRHTHTNESVRAAHIIVHTHMLVHVWTLDRRDKFRFSGMWQDMPVLSGLRCCLTVRTVFPFHLIEHCFPFPSLFPLQSHVDPWKQQIHIHLVIILWIKIFFRSFNLRICSRFPQLPAHWLLISNTHTLTHNLALFSNSERPVLLMYAIMMQHTNRLMQQPVGTMSHCFKKTYPQDVQCVWCVLLQHTTATHKSTQLQQDLSAWYTIRSWATWLVHVRDMAHSNVPPCDTIARTSALFFFLG